LTSMRVFLRVIDEGGFAAAARVLDMSPAVVTRLVADLEDHLGTRLLHRTTRKQSLTEAGETYVERVRMILQDLDEAHAMVSSQTRDLSGVLRILAPPVLATHVLAPVVAGFRKAYPNITLDIEVASHREPPIEEHDLTLFGADQGFDGNVIARKIIESDAILVASPGYLAQRGTPRAPADLLQHDCLHYTAPDRRSGPLPLFQADDATQAVEIPIKPVLWTNDADVLLRAALDGAGITVTTLVLAVPHLTTGALVRVLDPWIVDRYALYAALPSRKFLPQRTRVFLDYLIEQTQLNVGKALAVCGGKC
jgi:DNA-binding transcriptional LysR family regulator